MFKKLIIYIISYTILFALAYGALYVFKPYKYVNNATSKIICDKNNTQFDAGWNFVYTFEQKLDEFNDKKARKMCEYNTVRDYGDTLKTPPIINYRFIPQYAQESGWQDALIISIAVFFFGMIIIEAARNFFYKDKFTNQILYILLSALFGLLLFFLLLKKPATEIFCARQTARKVNNFKRVIFKFGIFPIPEEEKYIEKVIPEIYHKCLLR